METKNKFIPKDNIERELLDALRRYNQNSRNRVAFETTDIKSLTIQLRKVISEKLESFITICARDNRTQPIIDIMEIITQNLT